MAGFGSGADHQGYPVLERIIFGNRGVVLAIFALITLGFLLAASQLRIDAGFRKQLPLQHEYMQTFVDYEVEFGGANRVFVALIDKSGNMFNKEFFTALEAATEGVKAIQREIEGIDRLLNPKNKKHKLKEEDKKNLTRQYKEQKLRLKATTDALEQEPAALKSTLETMRNVPTPGPKNPSYAPSTSAPSRVWIRCSARQV